MAERPRVVMSASDLPQQRLWRVTGLPDRPAGWSAAIGTPPEADAPRRMPASARYLGQVEWAWSPMHMRIDAYHLSLDRSRTRWRLWVQHYDDNWSRWPEPSIEAVAPRARLAPDAAARLMLADYWRRARGGGVDRFHFVAQSGLLDAGAMQEVARVVWQHSDVRPR